MKPTTIQNVNTCSNLNSCDDLFSNLFYGEQADAVKKPHDTLADSESNQDTIGEAEDEANIVKKCVACFSFDYCDVSFLVCPMVDRLMLIDMYTTVYITNTISIAMYVYACYWYEDANYYATAVLGSAKSTLGLSLLAVIVTAFYKQIKMATTEYTEEGKKKEEEMRKLLM